MYRQTEKRAEESICVVRSVRDVAIKCMSIISTTIYPYIIIRIYTLYNAYMCMHFYVRRPTNLFYADPKIPISQR